MAQGSPFEVLPKVLLWLISIDWVLKVLEDCHSADHGVDEGCNTDASDRFRLTLPNPPES